MRPGNLSGVAGHGLCVRLALVAVIAACSGSPSPPPVGPVAAQSPIDAAPMAVDEPEPDDDHVLPIELAQRGRVIVTTSDPCGLIVQPVYFAQSSPTPLSNDAVDAIADMLICLDKESGLLLRLAIQAHADPSETDPDELTARRAQTVATMLVARKMPTLGPLELEPFGAQQPRDTSGTAEGRALNRRVDFLIVGRKTRGE